VETLERALLEHGPGQVVHGGAPGADTLADQIAVSRGWPTPEVHAADWDGLGRRAGPARNQRMVERGADVCLAFPMAGSRGTWDCVRRAREAQIPVKVYTHSCRVWRLQRGSVTCGVLVAGGLVIQAAPVVGWTQGRPWLEVKQQLKAKGWRGTPLNAKACASLGKGR
jgi:hypothetical protein